MRNLLGRMLAQEDYEASPNPSEEASIVMRGPLADAYTKALNLVYANDASAGTSEPGEATPNAPTETPVPEIDAAKQTLGLESLESDALIMRSMMARMAFEPPEKEKPRQTVYAVTQKDVTPQIVKEVVTELADSSDRQDEFILIIDGTQAGPNSQNVSEPTDTVKTLCASLEQLVVTMGGQSYHNFGEYARLARRLQHHNDTSDRDPEAPRGPLEHLGNKIQDKIHGVK